MHISSNLDKICDSDLQYTFCFEWFIVEEIRGYNCISKSTNIALTIFNLNCVYTSNISKYISTSTWNFNSVTYGFIKLRVNEIDAGKQCIINEFPVKT